MRSTLLGEGSLDLQSPIWTIICAVGTPGNALTHCGKHFRPYPVDLAIFEKMSKNVKNHDFQFQNTDLEEGRQWSLGAETETADSLNYLLKPFFPDFLDVVENLLGL